MWKMKRIVAIVLLLTSVLMFTACAPKKNTSITDNVDPEFAEGFRRGLHMYDKEVAERNGDSYCVDCEKFIEGKVRICPYCGKYI